LAREGNVVGEVFTDKLIDQALALARFYPHKINKNAPKLLVDAASAYFGTDRPAGWNEGKILGAEVLQQARGEMQVSIKNMLNLGKIIRIMYT